MTDDLAPIPLLDLKRSLAPIEAELQAAFTRVLQSGHYILGPEVDALEHELAEYCNVGHALGVSSGTDALLLALMGLGIGQGDDVLLPTYTFFATAGTVWRSGARPVLVDVCPGCFNMLPAALGKKHTKATRAVIPVHLFGQTAAMEAINAFATRHQLAVIEDAAQSLGAAYCGRRAGALGTVGCFSFFPTKNLGAFGDAGLVTTDDAALAEKMRILRVHGGKPKYLHATVGGNFRIDAMQAALLRVKLPHLDAGSAQRQRNAQLYTELFTASGKASVQNCICHGNATTPAPSTHEAPLGLPAVVQSRHVFNQYTVRVRNSRRDAVRRALIEHNIGNEIYYPVPMHLQPCFKSLGHAPGDFPHAEAAASESLALPIFPELRADEIERVAEAVLAAL
jgi:dTDP-4-amino-4,6-dideoxygalactose transaminase